MNAQDLKVLVQDKYGNIAAQSKTQNQSSCCGSTGCCDNMDYSIFSDDYTKLAGYNPDADLGLGCGIPTEFAGIKKGDHVLDLGSGAGNDCFVARTFVGEEGQVTGIDFTDAMLEKAQKNLIKTGFQNINFVKGDIEQMPLADNTFDVVISNCVLNLVPNKQKAFAEIYRVLKPGGKFCISDVVISGVLPIVMREAAELYAGCVSGAIQKDEYLSIIQSKGFKNIEVRKEKAIEVPDSILLNYMSMDELKGFKKSGIGIFSITTTAYK